MTTSENVKSGREKSASAFRTISEVSDELAVPQHVLRFWESKFTQLKPMKRAGGRRYYRPEDVQLLSAIRDLLYAEGYTIRGVQRLLKEKGVKGLIKRDAVGSPVSNDLAAEAPVSGTIAAAEDLASSPAQAEPGHQDNIAGGDTLPFPSSDVPEQQAAPLTAAARAELEDVLAQLKSLRETL